MESNEFFNNVELVVKLIPPGKVTTYGLIASALGLRSSARMVGWALNSFVGRKDLPCHRVVNRNGELSGKMHFATPFLMKELLLCEGIEFIDDRVNLKEHLWTPEQIPQ